MDKNYALRFLTWSYFKIDINDIIDSNDKKITCEDINDEKITCENIIKACIEKAYSDATMQGAYNTLLKKYVEKQVNKEQNEDLKKKIEKDLKEKNDSLKKEAEKFLSYGISILLGEELNQKKCYLDINKCYLGNETSKEKIDYGKWHDCMCDRLCEIYKENEFEKVPIFSYGNAQKWVNMTVKYLCVFYNIYETANLGHGFWGKWGVLEKYEQDFHVPIDNYILKNIWDEAFQTCGRGAKIKNGKKEWACMFKDIIKDKDKDKDKNKDKNEDNCECKDKCEYEDEDKCEKNIHGKSYNSDKVIAWSKWEEKEYKYFQEKLKEKIENPLNWEADAWIKIAKERNNKNNKENEK